MPNPPAAERRDEEEVSNERYQTPRKNYPAHGGGELRNIHSCGQEKQNHDQNPELRVHAVPRRIFICQLRYPKAWGNKRATNSQQTCHRESGGMLYRYGVDRPTTMVYAVGIAFGGLAQMGVWLHSIQAGFLDARVTDGLRRCFTIRLLIIPGLFLLSIPVALFNAQYGYLLWVLTLPTLILLRGRFPVGETSDALEYR